jgi:hypothetical protein
MTKQTDEIAALRAEVDALKAAQPKPQPTAEERARATREWMNEMHQMRLWLRRPRWSATGQSSTTGW